MDMQNLKKKKVLCHLVCKHVLIYY